MPRRPGRAAALALGLMLLSFLAATLRANAVEAQRADPGQCAGEDNECIGAWYKEYAAAILAEFKYYAGQEDFLAEMLTAPQETLLTARLSLILVEGGTRYGQWALFTDEQAAESAGLDMTRYRAVIGPCREAISQMRTALFDLRQHRGKVRSEAGQYLKNAVACEKAFGLPARLSKLRGKGQPARMPPAPLKSSEPATQGPMEISPVTPKP